MVCVLLSGFQLPQVFAVDGVQLPSAEQYSYPYPVQSAQQPAYVQPEYQPQAGYQPVQPMYGDPGYSQAYQPTYPEQWQAPQGGFAGQQYMPQTGYAGQYDPAAAQYGTQGYAAQPGYAQPAYPQTGYAAQGSTQQVPQVGFAPGAYVDPNLSYQTQQYPDPYPSGYYYPNTDPNAAQFSLQGYPRNYGSGFPMMNDGWGGNFFGGDNPFSNPADTRGYWAAPGFRPWSTGPLARDKWEDIHPMSNMPWGNFPGWSDGPFGGFGPDQWEGVTPWGNDVPFRWLDPTDPRDAIGDMWDDALNTPNRMGRMPPGWTAPYISVPNPIDVEEEFERNARNFPDEMRKAINTGESDWGGTAQPRYKNKDDEKKKREQKAAEKPKPEEKPWVKPMAPIKPYGQGFTMPQKPQR